MMKDVRFRDFGFVGHHLCVLVKRESEASCYKRMKSVVIGDLRLLRPDGTEEYVLRPILDMWENRDIVGVKSFLCRQ